MRIEYVPVRGQTFDVSRTINFAKCDCVKCTFLRCPKNNYAVKMTPKKHSIEEYWAECGAKILRLNKPEKWTYSFHGEYDLMLTYDMLTDFFDALQFSFPKGTFWSPAAPDSFLDILSTDTGIAEAIFREVHLVKFSRTGEEVVVSRIEIGNHTLHDCSMNKRQQKLAEEIRSAVKWLKEKVFEHYQEQNADWKIGWLAMDGRHYPCDHCEHSNLAHKLGGGEWALESEGWIKVALEDPDDGYFLTRHFPTAEQRNWLSLHGYILHDD